VPCSRNRSSTRTAGIAITGCTPTHRHLDRDRGEQQVPRVLATAVALRGFVQHRNGDGPSRARACCSPPRRDRRCGGRDGGSPGWLGAWMDGTVNPEPPETSYAALAALAAAVEPGSAGLTFMPYLAGMRTPEYDPGCPGCVHGAVRSPTPPANLVRSVNGRRGFRAARVGRGPGRPGRGHVRSVITAGGGARKCRVGAASRRACWASRSPITPHRVGEGESPARPGPAEAAGQFGARCRRSSHGVGSGLFGSLGRRGRPGPRRRSRRHRAGPGRGGSATRPGRFYRPPVPACGPAGQFSLRKIP